ncbi:uncharacterized protein LOC133866568 [Alnus glutinosa]|uniref:uncharacterized protein LOC133866568 n=1 Tax=Alnus glutinosa TaxID=3517 RepID=UPI002D792516|nr:uncharacterized protein LOC133866568 [Alnus glutinosa]
MQAGSVLALSPAFNLYPPARGYTEVADKVSEDFGAKLKLEAFGCESGDMENKEASKIEALDEKLVDGGENGKEEGEYDDDDDEFSFACVNPDGSPISADDAFADGQIRPIFPLFNRDLLLADAYDGDSKPEEDSSSANRPPLRNFFVEERDTPSSSTTSESDELVGAPSGPFCEWSGKAELSKKSNSTGFSKIWRFRDLVRRSNSDGRDAFVFLSHSSASAKPSSEPTTEAKKSDVVEKKEKVEKVEVKRVVRGAKTASSVHEAHYVNNRAKREGDKRKSYLPYRVGFFTNVNGLSRNVHPF